jgi:hypothetical protein
MRQIFTYMDFGIRFIYTHRNQPDLFHGPKVKVMIDRRSVGQSVLVSGNHLGPITRFYYCQTVGVR